MVIGAGVIGLSVAWKIADSGYSVVLLEKEARFGRGISSRNTEVIHAGIYYRTPLKAGLCVRGKNLLYEHCVKYGVKHRRAGKIILAVTEEEFSKLESTKTQAVFNGVTDLVELDEAGIKKLEPGISGKAALFSPSSGIVDTHGFMDSLLKLGEKRGVLFSALSPALGAEYSDNHWKIEVGGREPARISCRLVINAAGLYTVDLCKKVFPERNIPGFFPRKGSYARYSGRSPVSHIIYPALIPGVIRPRIDATPDLGGSLRFGPTNEEPESLEDFSIIGELAEKVVPSVKSYFPDLDASRVYPDTAGIRPRIFAPGDPPLDFCFEWAPIAGWLDLFGIESPGLTASLAIGEHVLKMVDERGAL